MARHKRQGWTGTAITGSQPRLRERSKHARRNGRVQEWVPLPKTVISLTTIPPRMDKIGPTLQSLLEQSAKIDEIILWIPLSYRRAEFQEFTLPVVPQGITIRRADHDYGPATKILPALKLFAGEDVRIIYCDDDRVYNHDWAQRMLDCSDRHPGECIAEAGEVVESLYRKYKATFPRYHFLKYATLGITSHFHRKKIRELNPGLGLADVCKGYGGVLVRPEFFTPVVFDIPDIMWTVDDIWLSGNLRINGIPIRQITRRENSAKSEAAFIDPLVSYIYLDHGRERANMMCVRYFQEKHGIWLGEGGRYNIA